MATQMMNYFSAGAISTGLVCAEVLPPWMEDSLRAISTRQEEKAKEADRKWAGIKALLASVCQQYEGLIEANAATAAALVAEAQAAGEERGPTAEDLDATDDQFSFSSSIWEYDDDDVEYDGEKAASSFATHEEPAPTLPSLPLTTADTSSSSTQRPAIAEDILTRLRKCSSHLDAALKEERTTSILAPAKPAAAQAATHKGLAARMQDIRRMLKGEDEEDTRDLTVPRPAKRTRFLLKCPHHQQRPSEATRVQRAEGKSTEPPKPLRRTRYLPDASSSVVPRIVTGLPPLPPNAHRKRALLKRPTLPSMTLLLPSRKVRQASSH